jgi:hypothetical protein
MSAETRLIEAAIKYSGLRLGPRATLKAIRLDIVGPDGVKQEIKLKPTGLGQSVEDEDDVRGTSIRRAIEEVLADAEAPLKAQTIARRAGRSCSGPFRATLAVMVRDGDLTLGEDGYSLNEDRQAEQAEAGGG